jgi:hypothetical protein
MPRPARRLFTLYPAGSLVVFVGLGVMWGRSHVVRDRWVVGGGSVSREFTSNAGRLTFVQITFENNPVPWTAVPFTWLRGPPGRGGPEIPMQWAWDAVRFSWRTRRQVGSGSNGRVTVTTREVSTPYWVPAALAGIMPAAWLRRTLGRRRLAALARRRICAGCRYDLRASPERCPECGLVSAAQRSA